MMIICDKFQPEIPPTSTERLLHAQNFLDLAVTLTFDLWPGKLLQQCWIFVPSLELKSVH